MCAHQSPTARDATKTVLCVPSGHYLGVRGPTSWYAETTVGSRPRTSRGPRVTQNIPAGSQREQLERLVETLDVVKLIQSFDADFDIPLAHGTANGRLHEMRECKHAQKK